MPFIHDDFLLHTEAARRLYHGHAEAQPILDFHSHLSAQAIADDHRFRDVAEVWLAGDHYKWRAMRADGVDERLCTGDAAPYEKFLAWARTVPRTVRNPLYHWTHLELKRHFGVDALLSETTAPAIWEEANARLQAPALSVRGLLGTFRVTALCTTDDPADPLDAHEAIARSGLPTRVYPTFRPDRALGVHDPAAWNAWVDKLAAAADTHVATLPDLLDALDRRHAAFHAAGGRLSDHGLGVCPADFPTDAQAAALFDRARAGQAVAGEEQGRLAAFLMLHFGRLDAGRGWTKQLHLGALRNVNTAGLRRLGPDTGFDGMGDGPQAAPLGAYLDRLNAEGALPRTILYNVNPADNYAFAALAGSFQGGTAPGRMQLGAAWWFLDTKEGMEAQLSALSNTGLLARFVGMVTDSRSWLSFPRHEYFRRVLCDLLGRDIARGEIPDDDALLGPLVAAVCHGNARDSLGLTTGPTP